MPHYCWHLLFVFCFGTFLFGINSNRCLVSFWPRVPTLGIFRYLGLLRITISERQPIVHTFFWCISSYYQWGWRSRYHLFLFSKMQTRSVGSRFNISTLATSPSDRFHGINRVQLILVIWAYLEIDAVWLPTFALAFLHWHFAQHIYIQFADLIPIPIPTRTLPATFNKQLADNADLKTQPKVFPVAQFGFGRAEVFRWSAEKPLSPSKRFSNYFSLLGLSRRRSRGHKIA